MDLLHKRDFAASPYRSEREKLIAIKRWNVRKFFKLLNNLEDFFENDKCFRFADNYLIAMVFTYFLRASLEPEEYTRDNFFAALMNPYMIQPETIKLLLAYDLEEDDGEFMQHQLEDWIECLPEIRRLRYELFQRMEYRAAVSRSCCDVVMRSANPEHKVWQRHRHAYHAGVITRKFLFPEIVKEEVCPICEGCDSGDELE